MVQPFDLQRPFGLQKPLGIQFNGEAQGERTSILGNPITPISTNGGQFNLQVRELEMYDGSWDVLIFGAA
jgi:hypothetical protein